MEASAEEAKAIQFVAGALLCVHVIPKLVEMKICCPLTATHLEPSADEETNDASKEFVNIQLFPKLVETKIPKPPTISRVPSAEEATESQVLSGRLFVIHAAPEFVEVKSAPPKLNEINAASFRPSDDEASEYDVVPIFDTLGRLFDIQAAPEFVEA